MQGVTGALRRMMGERHRHGVAGVLLRGRQGAFAEVEAVGSGVQREFVQLRIRFFIRFPVEVLGVDEFRFALRPVGRRGIGGESGGGVFFRHVRTDLYQKVEEQGRGEPPTEFRALVPGGPGAVAWYSASLHDCFFVCFFQ